ncbi:uncharacterized protein LOC129884179 [Solanum dulcamara]|uniref:uncharacterized protein LOC129884179 n=1 Tax=Solanum dulcamara TaxID=45834 RepID=UPI0024855BFF|nr:uncharacterized protein LOC129884179 [Solanum dulcamara]
MSDTPSLVAGSPAAPCTPDVSIGSSSSSSTSTRLIISVVGENFVPNSKTIIETFKERQDATGYTWKDVSQSTLYQWNPTVNSMIEGKWNKVVRLVVQVLAQASILVVLGQRIKLRPPPNSWDIFKKLHKRKDGSFVDAKSKCINDKMEVVIVAAISIPSDDSQEVQELDINRLYFDVVGGEKKSIVCMIGLSKFDIQNSVTSRNLSAVSDDIAEERIKVLEEEVLHMRENQERILQELEAEVQQ